MDDHVTYSRNIKRLLNENGLTLEMAAGRADIVSLLFCCGYAAR